MNIRKWCRPNGAFSMTEAMVVTGIISLLAALLLPALTAGKQKAKRIACENQLHQVGIAFHGFAHDHNSKFPMHVPISEGGSLEFVQNGYLVSGPFYFGFRHFQPLAGLLDTTKILVCPADTRLPATNFATLQNSNISYFVAVNAEYSQPMSILAGDGNLAGTATLIRGVAGKRLTWTEQQHRFRGNVLFSDGHVEEWGGSEPGQLTASTDLVLPSIGGVRTLPQHPAGKTTGNPAPDPLTGSGTNIADPQPRPLPPSPAMSPTSASGQKNFSLMSAETIQTEIASPAPPPQVRPETNSSIGVVSSPGEVESLMSPFDRKMAKFLQHLVGWSYLLLLLLLLLLVAYRLWRRYHDPRR